jgi:hypothetical protein
MVQMILVRRREKCFTDQEVMRGFL